MSATGDRDQMARELEKALLMRGSMERAAQIIRLLVGDFLDGARVAEFIQRLRAVLKKGRADALLGPPAA